MKINITTGTSYPLKEIIANLRKIENKLILSKLSKNGLQYNTKNSINIIIYW